MGVFAYTGVDDKGRTVRGTIDADTVKTVRQLLRKRGVFLDDARPLNTTAGAAKTTTAAPTNGANKKASAATATDAVSTPSSLSQTIRRIRQSMSNPVQAVSLMTRQLATLLKAGIPLTEALSALLEQLEDETLQKAMTQVRDRVREGIALAKALDEHPRYFGALYVNMVQAGEAAGNLEVVLARLADFTEQQVKLRNKLSGALAYPAFMAVFGGVIVTIMMVVVVPKVTAIFADFKKALPWYTELMVFISNLLGSYFWLIGIIIGVGVYLFNRWKRTPEGAYRWDAIVLKLPIFGDLARMVAISRFARTLSTLLAAGVPVLKALDIVKNVLGNKVLEGVVAEASVSIKEGESIAEPLKRSGKFPPIVTHMIAVGERSGELEAMLDAVAASFDGHIETKLQVLTSLLEPMMIALMGGISGGIAFSILMPLMQLNDFAQ